jgi:hypothetical protein
LDEPAQKPADITVTDLCQRRGQPHHVAECVGVACREDWLRRAARRE